MQNMNSKDCEDDIRKFLERQVDIRKFRIGYLNQLADDLERMLKSLWKKTLSRNLT